MTTTEVMKMLHVKAKVLLRWELEDKLIPISKKGKVGLYYCWQIETIMLEGELDKYAQRDERNI